MNLPNSITLTRIAAVPLLIWILVTPRLSSEATGSGNGWPPQSLILASITDGIDGYLARKRGQNHDDGDAGSTLSPTNC